jgi:hypothetical protein
MSSSLFHGVCHELLFGTFRANDVFSIRDKALANQRSPARRAEKAIIMPMTAFKRDEASATNSYRIANMQTKQSIQSLRARACKKERDDM